MTLQQLSKRLQSFICPKKYEITKTAMLSSMKERTISRKVNVYTNITMYCIDYPVKSIDLHLTLPSLFFKTSSKKKEKNYTKTLNL